MISTTGRSPAQGHPSRQTHETRFGNGRRQHPRGESFGQATRDFEGAPIGVQNIFTQHIDEFVFGKDLVQSLVEQF